MCDTTSLVCDTNKIWIHIWKRHHTSMGHVTHDWVMSHIYESCHTSMIHVTYKQLVPHTTESSYLHLRNVTHGWSFSNMNVSCHARERSCHTLHFFSKVAKKGDLEGYPNRERDWKTVRRFKSGKKEKRKRDTEIESDSKTARRFKGAKKIWIVCFSCQDSQWWCM